MQLKCPACNAAFSLESALAVDAGRSALKTALELPALGGLLAHYLGMFRAPNRALSFARAENLLLELKPWLDSETVARGGNVRRCPHALWQQGLERMIEQRDAGKLQLPLKTHGYLLEIVYALAEQAGAREEKAIEESRRRGEGSGRGAQRATQMLQVSRIRGDVELGLLTREQAIEQLAGIGIAGEALDG
ncbi:MAG: hypothetical protein F9K31_06565 [Dokdonella sp.]|nr:MAG: hypothetical protein F9K31_06565 [Dokdonella sp.]